LRATAEKPWDRLCDHLAGRGVANLEDALIGLELTPAHAALRRLLEPALLRKFAELYDRAPAGPEKSKALELERADFFDTAWRRSREFLRESQSFYRSHNDGSVVLDKAPDFTNPAVMTAHFRELARAAMRVPALEKLFPEPWPAAARRVLPSLSPKLMATEMWGPVLAWSILELLAESISAHAPERAALDLFDRLRLREPLARAFEALGFPAEESWRVAARIKVALLVEAKVFIAPEHAEAPKQAEARDAAQAQPADAQPEAFAAPLIPVLSPALWQDADVRWLTGAHTDGDHSYFVKESYEELLWWLQLPALCKLAAHPAPARSKIQEIGKAINAAVTAAAAANYRIDLLFEPGAGGPHPTGGPHPPTVGECGASMLGDSSEKLSSDENEAEKKTPVPDAAE
jgi:hypothetical protein